jgi:hypothetical protein
MSAPVAAWPSSRHVLGWWRELAGLRPLRLWLGHLALHHVEALVATSRPHPLDPLSAALLRLANCAGPPADLPARLGLDPALLGGIMRLLADEGLLEPAGRSLTPAGRQVLAAGTVPAAVRRSFWFLDRSESGLPPHLLPLHDTEAAPLMPDAGWHFDPAVLAECAGRPPQWKARFGFPADAESVLLPGDAADWRRVVLDRPGQLAALLLEVPGADGGSPTGLTAFAVQATTWTLVRDGPVLELDQQWREVFPDLAAAPAADVWRQAWRTWCQPRSVPPADAEACVLEPAGDVLRVRAPRRLVDRLKAARSDAVKGEAWLLAGTGRVRALARIELHQ